MVYSNYMVPSTEIRPSDCERPARSCYCSDVEKMQKSTSSERHQLSRVTFPSLGKSHYDQVYRTAVAAGLLRGVHGLHTGVLHVNRNRLQAQPEQRASYAWRGVAPAAPAASTAAEPAATTATAVASARRAQRQERGKQGCNGRWPPPFAFLCRALPSAAHWKRRLRTSAPSRSRALATDSFIAAIRPHFSPPVPCKGTARLRGRRHPTSSYLGGVPRSDTTSSGGRPRAADAEASLPYTGQTVLVRPGRRFRELTGPHPASL